MSKGHYPYADDEFDAPADPDAPHGVHHAPRSAWSRWWPFLVVLVVVPLLAFGTVWYLTQDGNVPSIPGVASGTSATSDSDSTSSEEATETDTTEATEEPAEPAEPAPEATVDLTTAVEVLNAAGVKGLAATAQGKLNDAGFTAVTVDNADKGSLTESTVYYATENQSATAAAVAETLGLTAVTLSAEDAGTGIRVFLIENLPS